jgi:hypothetical protein
VRGQSVRQSLELDGSARLMDAADNRIKIVV